MAKKNTLAKTARMVNLSGMGKIARMAETARNSKNAKMC